ncbi:MAG: phosphotransferase [Gammaproteobacteria bacterium]|nr:phosphotransferase [Gammaproteobacteria bacterium]
MDSGEQVRLEDGRILSCIETVRSLPQKRQVFLGDLDGRPVFAKLYLDPGRRQKHWQRELNGINAFQQHDIPTAELLYAGTVGDEKYPLIVLARLMEPVSLKVAWDKADSAACKRLLEDMVAVLARHHMAGVRQADLHLDNFVISEGQIYSLDGAGVSVVEEELGLNDGLDNLALFLAQLSPRLMVSAPELYDLYLTQRGADQGPGSDYLLWQIKQSREWRWKKFQGKLFRECTAMRYRKSLSRLEVVSRCDVSPEMDVLLTDPSSSFSDRDKTHKNGASSTVWTILVGKLPVVVKRYNSRGIFKEILQRFVPGRALVSWVNANMLMFFDVSTARPMAVLKIKRSFWKTESYFLTEETKNETLYRWLLDEARTQEEKKIMTKKVVSVFCQLFSHQITHGDMKEANWLVFHNEPVLIDLDSMKRHRSKILFKRARRGDLRRFMKNWKDLPELFVLFEDEFKAQGLGWS